MAYTITAYTINHYEMLIIAVIHVRYKDTIEELHVSMNLPCDSKQVKL